MSYEEPIDARERLEARIAELEAHLKATLELLRAVKPCVVSWSRLALIDALNAGLRRLESLAIPDAPQNAISRLELELAELRGVRGELECLRASYREHLKAIRDAVGRATP